MKCRLFLACLAVGIVMWPGRPGSAQEFPYLVFERYLEPLAQQIGMPGLSAVIIRNNNIEWHRGYGYANVEAKTPADIDTPYAIGNVTQAITGVLIGICVDRHLLPSIDVPIRTWVPTFPDAGATVRDVLAHISTGRFQYDPGRFAALTTVVESCLKQPYRVAATTEVLDRLAMTRSVPGMDLSRPEGAAARELFDTQTVNRYQSLLTQLAVPYRIGRGGPARSEYPSYGVDAAGGLVATAHDLARRFEAALDDGEDNIPLSLSTLTQMWAPIPLPNNAGVAPTGLGWFSQTASGVRLVWTFGHLPNASSALILKMPSKRLTLVLLANSGGLAEGFNFEGGDVTTSPFVKVFLRLFI
jgi:CubicO group peptidase (beta-lactamase class C family)